MGMYSKHSAESVAEHNWMHTEYVWNTSGYGQDTLEYVFRSKSQSPRQNTTGYA